LAILWQTGDNIHVYLTHQGDSDHYLVVAKVRDRLAVNKRRSHINRTESFYLKKLNEVEGKEQYHVEVLNTFSALEDLDAVLIVRLIKKKKKLPGLSP
jgi:hypothetical protein